MVVGDDDDDDDDDDDENDDTQQYCAKPGCFNYPPKVTFCFFPPNGRDGKQTVSAMYSHQIGIEDKVTRQNQDAKIHISMFTSVTYLHLDMFLLNLFISPFCRIFLGHIEIIIAGDVDQIHGPPQAPNDRICNQIWHRQPF